MINSILKETGRERKIPLERSELSEFKNIYRGQ